MRKKLSHKEWEERLERLQKDKNDPRWKNFEPVTCDDMKFKGYRYTVCEILREIYRATDDPEIQLKCRMAVSMSKKMAVRISHYEGRKWGRSQYPWNPNRRHDRVKEKYDLPQETWSPEFGDEYIEEDEDGKNNS